MGLLSSCESVFVKGGCGEFDNRADEYEDLQERREIDLEASIVSEEEHEADEDGDEHYKSNIISEDGESAPRQWCLCFYEYAFTAVYVFTSMRCS